ncbi:hypothetical protein EOE18_13915 [Novosphingobium umbonatum]|uniref:Uncharacterized protein n=1 Tax=Novosphingobium umbonatum TaxID=1908524 RepID=A0A437N272_9SPHN|nr:hypothetical protein [Novosphingobium umbonatum]RVU03945.1 hypothetical protein EOE18_13915 [Novosphingobium umbonatum]
MDKELSYLRHENDRLIKSNYDLSNQKRIGMRIADSLNNQLTADLAKAHADLAIAVAALKVIERRGVNSASATEARRALAQIAGIEAAPAENSSRLREWLKGKFHD